MRYYHNSGLTKIMLKANNSSNAFFKFPHLSFIVVLLCAAIAFGAEMQPGDTTQSNAGFQEAGRVVLPINQVLTPAGRQVELPLMRPQVIKLSPDGNIIITSGKTPRGTHGKPLGPVQARGKNLPAMRGAGQI